MPLSDVDFCEETLRLLVSKYGRASALTAVLRLWSPESLYMYLSELLGKKAKNPDET